MSQGNQTTTIKEFVIIGFPGVPAKYFDLIGGLIFLHYISTVAGNALFVTLFLLQHNLHMPMYIVMVSLALSDLSFCTVTLPKAIAKYWFDAGTISFHACFFQRQLVHYFGALNSLIMMLMALDRYLAICFPLQYPMLMTNRLMGLLNGLAWATAMISPTIATSMAIQLPFCGPKEILQYYCDARSITRLACGNTSLEDSVSFSLAMFVLLLPFSLIVFSYINVIVAVCRIASKQGRLKTLSTSAPQFGIISLYYIPRFFVHLTPYIPNMELTVDARIGLQLFYCYLPPLVNPLIYCFRTKEVKVILRKFLSRKVSMGLTKLKPEVSAICR